MDTLTLISGHWMPSRLRFPLLFLLPLILLAPALHPKARFLPVLPVTQAPLASEYPDAARAAEADANRVASDHLYPILSDEMEIRAQLKSGTLPTWNPDVGLGAPLSAGSMAAPWNPLRWPFLWMPPAIAGAWHALFALVLAGLGMLLFLEGRGLKFTAAFFGALAFQGSGFLVANLHYVMKVDAIAWAPWCLWGVDLVYRRRKNAGLLIFAGLGMSALSGFPQVFAFVAALTVAWILVRALEAIRNDNEAPVWKRSLGAALCFASLGVMAGSVHLLPMWEASRQSTRALQEPHVTQAQSLPTLALATSVLPSMFGAPTELNDASQDPAMWWLLPAGQIARGLVANRIEWNFFVGVTVLALVLSALCARSRQACFPALVVFCAWGFVFDWPGLEFAYGLPGMNLGAPARMGAIAALGLAWLAALGFDALLEGRNSARTGAMLVASAGVLLGVYLWASVQPGDWSQDLDAMLQARHSVDLATVREFFSVADAERAAQRIASGGLRLAMFSVAVAALSVYAGRLTVRGSGVAGCIVLLVELSAGGLPHTTMPRSELRTLFPASETIDAIAEAAGTGRVLRIDRSSSGVADLLQLARPDMLPVYGIKDLTPYHAFPSKALAEVWRAFEPDGLFRGGVASLRDANKLGAPLLDALRVTCVLSTSPLDSEHVQLLYERPGFHVYHRPGAQPEARVVPELVTAELASLADPFHDFAASAVVSAPAPTSVASATTDFVAGDVKTTRPAADRIDVGVTGSTGGWLVVHEAWAPGWKATINDEEVAVLRLDHLFLGVPLPAGNSLVRLHYEPSSLRLGALLSLLSIVLSLWITRLRHHSKSTAVSPSGNRAFSHARSSSR